MLDSRAIFRQAWRDGLTPDPDMLLSDWADAHRMLPKEASKEPGPYRCERTPYLVEPMDTLSPMDPTNHVVVIKGTQLGWTTIGENLLFMVAHLYPAPCLVLLPTLDLLKRFSQNRISPALKEMQCLKSKIAPPRKRDSGNTVDTKRFPGGFWRFATSNSAPALRSDPIRFLILDDRDGFDIDVNGEGEPGNIAKRRTDTFARSKKIYENSTPTDKQTSRILRSWEISSQAEYYIPCPICSKHFKMGKSNWEQMKFKISSDGTIDPTSVYWECEHCKGAIHEHHKTEILRQGYWLHSYPTRPIKGFKLPSLYSPIGWLSWVQVCQEYIEAVADLKAHDPSAMKTWENTRMAEAWEEKLKGAEAMGLYNRREDYGPTVPMGGLVLTAAVDVQDDRLEVGVIAWGKGYENWGIDYQTLEGSTVKREVWAKLHEYLQKRFEHESGIKLKIQMTAIDSGYNTEEVYSFCGPRRATGVIAVKGATPTSVAALPIVGPPKEADYGAIRYPVGTNAAKDAWARWLTVTEAGPKACHFPLTFRLSFLVC